MDINVSIDEYINDYIHGEYIYVCSKSCVKIILLFIIFL